MESATAHTSGDAATMLAELNARVAEGKVYAEDLLANGKRRAQRMARKGFELGEDCLDESRLYIKHNPWQSLGLALGAGFLVGCVGVFLFSRRR